jgi:hypothetical protein
MDRICLDLNVRSFSLSAIVSHLKYKYEYPQGYVEMFSTVKDSDGLLTPIAAITCNVSILLRTGPSACHIAVTIRAVTGSKDLQRKRQLRSNCPSAGDGDSLGHFWMIDRVVSKIQTIVTRIGMMKPCPC